MNESFENTSFAVSWSSSTDSANDSVPWTSSTRRTSDPDLSTSPTENTSDPVSWDPPTGSTLVPVTLTSLTTTPMSLTSTTGYFDSSIIALLCTGVSLVFVISVIAVCKFGFNSAPRVHKRVRPKGLVFGVSKFISKHYLSENMDDESLSTSDSDDEVKTGRIRSGQKDRKCNKNKIQPLNIAATQF